ncbi:MAG: HD domain-containing protein [Clostridia bacterium]|nr:HD domain-containing protein [Clostridia bacterium]
MIKIALAILIVTQLFTLLLLKGKHNKIKKIMKLYDIGKKITSNIKLKRLMKEIMELAKEEVQAEACSLYLVDEEKQELWFEVALGGKGDKVKEIRVKIGEGISGWVAKEGVTLNLKDVNQDPRFSAIGKKIDFKQKAMLTMPVKFHDKTIGVIQLINKVGGGFFTREDEEFLEGMTSQIAIALENAKLYQGMHDLFVDAISALAGAVDAKDPYTNGHSHRVTEYSLEIGKEMGFSEEQMEQLEYMALLHDVGKIGICDSVLNKQSRLDDEEFALMKSHVLIGSKILESMKSLKYIIPGVRYHHEKFDGTGYYDGLKGDEIPLEARIIAVADTFDAMTTTRPYRKGLEFSVAINEINRCSGTQFDPEVVNNFNSVFNRKLENQSNA